MLTTGIIRGPQDRNTMDKAAQPPLIPMAPFQQFFIPGSYTVQMPSALAAAGTPMSNTSGDAPLTNVGVASWAPLAPLRPVPGASCFSPAEVYYGNNPGSCIVPMAGSVDTKPPIQTLNDTILLGPGCKDSPPPAPPPPPPPPPPPSAQHTSETSDHPLQVKQETSGSEERQSCTQQLKSNPPSEEPQPSYPINALIDMPGSLNRGSRTSSLSSSLSSFRFGGSLSQLWAASLNSLSGKVPNMKSTGNLHADSIPLPSLGNQYFAFGGSLPELSLTSLTRLLPTSNSGSSSEQSSSSGSGIYTFIQPPLCVYPSQPHLATPFINPNGSITFGSFLSSGSSLCSQKADSPPSSSSTVKQSKTQSSPSTSKGPAAGPSSSTHRTVPPSSSPSPVPSNPTGNHTVPVSVHRSTHTNPPQPLTNLSTLAYAAAAAAARKTSDVATTSSQDTSLSSVVRQDSSPVSSSSFSPTKPLQDPMDCAPSVHPPTSSSSGHIPMHYMNGTGESLIEEDKQTMGGYSEVRHFTHLPPVDEMLAPRPVKRERKEKPYKCDYPGCGRYFSFPAHLRSHVQQIHISYRPCKCDFPGCGKRFYTPQHLNVHQRIHTGERPFVCPYAECAKAFTTAGNLKNHIRTHTGERPYACKFEGCTKRFAEMSSLKKHELTHTGEKPYKCRVCGKAFSQAGSRNTHERKHSRSEEEDEGKLSRRYRIKRIASGSDTAQEIN